MCMPNKVYANIRKEYFYNKIIETVFVIKN